MCADVAVVTDVSDVVWTEFGGLYNIIGFEVVYSIVSCFLYFMYDFTWCLICVHPDTQAGSHLLSHVSFITIYSLYIQFSFDSPSSLYVLSYLGSYI